jgi:predicted house-cleaning noncanonical NTP pyrophosphatase (MazG superfamily)
MELVLTDAECALLRETMGKAINDLLMEIARTDNRKMRGMLKEREEVMKALLAKLSAGERAA